MNPLDVWPPIPWVDVRAIPDLRKWDGVTVQRVVSRTHRTMFVAPLGNDLAPFHPDDPVDWFRATDGPIPSPPELTNHKNHANVRD